MAEHFLARSASYFSFCHSLTGKAVLRRKIICEYMTPEYKLDLSNGTENEIFNEIARDKYKPANITQNFQTFRDDCALLRYLYCWLIGNAVEKTELEQRASMMTLEVIKCFQKDNIRSWKQINPSEPIGKTVETNNPPPNKHVLETIALTGENKAEISALKNQIADLQSTIVVLSNQKNFLETANKVAEDELISLRDEIRKLKAEMNTITDGLKALHEIVSSLGERILHFLGKKEKSPHADD